MSFKTDQFHKQKEVTKKIYPIKINLYKIEHESSTCTVKLKN